MMINDKMKKDMIRCIEEKYHGVKTALAKDDIEMVQENVLRLFYEELWDASKPLDSYDVKMEICGYDIPAYNHTSIEVFVELNTGYSRVATDGNQTANFKLVDEIQDDLLRCIGM